MDCGFRPLLPVQLVVKACLVSLCQLFLAIPGMLRNHQLTGLFASRSGWIAVLLLQTLSFQAYAQAGSRPVLFYDSPATFYNSLSGSAPGLDEATQGLAVVPQGVWSLPSSTRYLLWVELSAGRLSVLENLGDGGLVVRRRIPVSIGKRGIGKQAEGDQKTPVGIYRIQDFLADAGIDDFYGTGAYPLNYPNALDRLQARTGHGIWLHGLPKESQQRPFLASEGCVVVDNLSLLSLANEIDVGNTVMVLSKQPIQWVPRYEQNLRARSLQQAMSAWEAAWESRNNEDYLDYYAEDFSDLEHDKAAWSEYKRQVNGGKRYINVDISEVSMLAEPGERDLVRVVFQQRYSSDNFEWNGRKEQLWRKAAQGWQIIYEGNI
jgi:murein L,D-transpeptidase YafK